MLRAFQQLQRCNASSENREFFPVCISLLFNLRKKFLWAFNQDVWYEKNRMIGLADRMNAVRKSDGVSSRFCAVVTVTDRQTAVAQYRACRQHAAR